MLESLRWFGPDDPVSLDDIRQAGAKGVVTALHHIPNGEIWSTEEILQRKMIIENKGMVWAVVESIPIHEHIKTRTGNYSHYINNYKQSISNLAACGIEIICYNFMPVLDWTRTDLSYEFADGSKGLTFERLTFIAFEVYLLQRFGATDLYTSQELKDAKNLLDHMSESEKATLINTIIAGLPGTEEGYTLEQFNEVLETYSNIDESELRENLILFLKDIIPVASQKNVLMCLHPDDPPFSILGLPRVVSTEEDYAYLFSKVPDRANGITFCTGSLGVRADNKLLKILKRFSDRVHFLHFRSTQRDAEGNFHEANHLEGDVDMYSLVKEVLFEERRRGKLDLKDSIIPMRPDHGHQMLDDLHKNSNSGYSGIGRLKGLAELRGLAHGIKKGFYENE